MTINNTLPDERTLACTLAPPKYVVLKYDDYMDLADKYGISPEDEEIIGDAVVIRPQDRHAAAGLSAYTLSLHTTIEALENAGVEVPEALLKSRDYFVEQTLIATEVGHKDPD